jgi:hypothetical protein
VTGTGTGIGIGIGIGIGVEARRFAAGRWPLGIVGGRYCPL